MSFPSSPSDGDTYERYIYSSSAGAWLQALAHSRGTLHFLTNAQADAAVDSVLTPSPGTGYSFDFTGDSGIPENAKALECFVDLVGYGNSPSGDGQAIVLSGKVSTEVDDTGDWRENGQISVVGLDASDGRVRLGARGPINIVEGSTQELYVGALAAGYEVASVTVNVVGFYA